MRARYLGVIGDPGLQSRFGRRLEAPGGAGAGLRVILGGQDILLLAGGDPTPLRIDERGAVLGRLYRKGCDRPIDELAPGAAAPIVHSRGGHLVDAYWGGYVAITEDRAAGSVSILRAPLGDLPCYYVTLDGALVFASDRLLLEQSGALVPAVDRDALARFMAAPNVRRAETCLVGLRELPGGSRLTCRAGETLVEPVWSPWTAAGCERALRDPQVAADDVRGAVLHAVAAASAGHDRLILKMSGGLDSSIVAAALREAGRAFDCLTLFTRNPAGDERAPAATVAAALDAPLFARLRDPALVDITLSAGAGLPRPDSRAFAQVSRAIAGALAAERGASAIVDGAGGDGVFCSLQSARPAIDCLRDPLARSQFWRVARDIARLTQSSLPQVAWRAFAMRDWPVAYPVPVDLRFLSSDARQLAPGALQHPWLEPPDGALPGKAAHVSLVMTAQSVGEAIDPLDPLPTVSPLISQPVIEACLRVPSWLWLHDGHERAVARAAFAPLLPAATVARRSKGTPDGLLVELFDLYRAELRELLLDGVLRTLDLLDREAIARALDRGGPVIGYDFVRILRLADVEAWARTIGPPAGAVWHG